MKTEIKTEKANKIDFDLNTKSFFLFLFCCYNYNLQHFTVAFVYILIVVSVNHQANFDQWLWLAIYSLLFSFNLL